MTEAGGRDGLLAGLRAGAGVLWPVVVLSGLALVALQPSGAAGPASGLALLPLAGVTRFGARLPPAVACPLAALCGAGLDILAQGPMGFWALIYAAGAVLGAQAPGTADAGFGARWAVFCLHLGVLVGLQGALVLACTHSAPAWEVILRQSVVAALLFPLVAWMIPLPKLIPGVRTSVRLGRR